MQKGFLIIALVVIISLYILNKVNTARQLEFTIGVPKEVKLDGTDITFILPLKAQNVTAGSIRINSLDFDLYTAGKFLGKALLTEKVTIVPNSFTVFNIAVRISLFDVVSSAKSIVDYFKVGKVGLTLDGIIYAEGFQIPYKHSFDFDYKNVL